MNELFRPKREIPEEIDLIKRGDLVLDSFGVARVVVRYDEQKKSVFIKNKDMPDSEAMEVRLDAVHKIIKPKLEMGDRVKNDQGEEKVFVCFDENDILKTIVKDLKSGEDEEVDWRSIHFFHRGSE